MPTIAGAVALAADGDAPESRWRMLVARHVRDTVKPPFNDSAREAAGLTRDFYAGLA